MNQISVKQEELSSQIKLIVQILLILIGLVIVLIVISLFYPNISCERYTQFFNHTKDNFSIRYFLGSWKAQLLKTRIFLLTTHLSLSQA